MERKSMLLTEHIAHNASTRGEHPFILHEGSRVSFREFDAMTNRAARALVRLGVVKGDRVTLALGNSIDWPVAAFGVLKAGAILNPVNPGLGASELGYILGHAEPRVIVTNADSAKTILAPALRRPPSSTVAAFGDVPGTISLDALMRESSDRALALPLDAGGGSTLLYTSGTTGNPKGVLFTHGRTGTSGPDFIRGMGITEDDVILTVGPLFHGNAWSAVAVAQQAGCAVAFPRTFHASEFWRLVHATGATAMFTLGTILAILLAQPPSELERTSKLRVILGLGSAPIRDQVIERFGIRHLLECFGSTDAGVVTLEPRDVPPRKGSSGPPIPGVEIRITDDAGNALPVRQVGEITVLSPARMAEYFHDPEQTRKALRGDWFLTGDLGYVDEDGWLYFVDRKRDVIRRGGENISSVLVEKALREHPQVVDVAVIGVRHAVLGQEVKAYVVTRSAVSEEELRLFAAERLAKFQVPTLWEFRDSLPKTPTQRVEKYKLREEHEGAGKPLLG
jgi:acyl-CoA synthetase (AMP-forming)/AMP-acid ligase II